MKSTIDRKKLNWKNIEKLPTTNDMLDNLYGKEGTYERELFKTEAYSYYNGQIMGKVSKKTKMTQVEFAE